MSPTDPDETLARALSRLDAIEARLNALENRRTRPAAGPAAALEPPTATELPPPIPLEATQPETHFETQVGLTWLNRIGVITVVLGVAFFFKYAVDRGLIGPITRVILGVVLSFFALSSAELMWRRSHRIYAQGITGAGIAILYISFYASFGMYHLLPLVAVFLLMGFATSLTIALSLRYKSSAIAALGFIGGYFTPLILSTNRAHPWALFGYLLILQLGGIALIRRTKWQIVEPVLIAGTSLVYCTSDLATNEVAGAVSALTFYGVFWKFSSRASLIAAQILATIAIVMTVPRTHSQALWLCIVLAGAGILAVQLRPLPRLLLTTYITFWLFAFGETADRILGSPVWMILALTTGFCLFLGYASWFFASSRRAEDRDRSSDVLTAPCFAILASNGLIYFAICYWILRFDYHIYLGIFAVALSALHIFAAWQMRRRIELHVGANLGMESERLRPVLLAIGVGATFFTLAIPIQFAGFRITMAWAIEAALFTWIAARAGYKRFGRVALAVFGLVFIRLVIIDGPAFFLAGAYPLLANARFLTLIVSGVCAWLGARWMEKTRLAVALYIAGHVAVLWAIMAESVDWVKRHASINDTASVSSLTISVVMAVYGITLVTLGVTGRSLVNRLCGLTLFALVILKLYLYDVWQLGESFRIIAFVLLGALILGGSFLYSRYRGVIDKVWGYTSEQDQEST